MAQLVPPHSSIPILVARADGIALSLLCQILFILFASCEARTQKISPLHVSVYFRRFFWHDSVIPSRLHNVVGIKIERRWGRFISDVVGTLPTLLTFLTVVASISIAAMTASTASSSLSPACVSASRLNVIFEPLITPSVKFASKVFVNLRQLTKNYKENNTVSIKILLQK
jgi:hypothetical protein